MFCKSFVHILEIFELLFFSFWIILFLRKTTAFLIVLHKGYPSFIDSPSCSFWDRTFFWFSDLLVIYQRYEYMYIVLLWFWIFIDTPFLCGYVMLINLGFTNGLCILFTQKKNRFGVKMTAFLFFSYSLHAKRIKKVMKRKKLIFKTICFYTIIWIMSHDSR